MCMISVFQGQIPIPSTFFVALHWDTAVASRDASSYGIHHRRVFWICEQQVLLVSNGMEVLAVEVKINTVVAVGTATSALQDGR